MERCALCGAKLEHEHRHLIDVMTRQLSCACEACTVLFAHRGESSLRSVGRHARRLPEFAMSDAEWEALRIPIGLAFFVYDSAAARITAFYPGPAGPTESQLGLEAWGGIAARNPELAAMEPDVEALLVNRMGSARDHYLTPVDRCYELAGMIRMHWRGLSGGDEVWRQIDGFFTRLREGGNA
uniref:Uncharacterized protein n=1 Tax=Solibacter usitatus (strain Ellin6076) TaxID=234267 RepID=Q01S90_SOLUE